jgi:hypothetical protein
VLTNEEFLDRFNKRLDYFLNLMNQTWGFRPTPTIQHEWIVRLDVPRLNQYGKRRFFIKQSTSGKARSPHRIAAYAILPHTAHKSKKYHTIPALESAQGWIDAFYKEIDVIGPKSQINASVEQGLAIRVNFNIKNFIHKGQCVYCTHDTMTKRRNPESIARMFAVELNRFRNVFQPSGVAPLYHRIRGYDAGINSNVPPDAIEEILHPRLSNALKARLKKNMPQP